MDEEGYSAADLAAQSSEEGENLKGGLGAAFGQLIIAPSVLAQAWVNKVGSNLQAVVGLLNTTHNALYTKQNASLNAHANLLANISAAHAVLLTNNTNAFLAHLDTHKVIAQNVSDAVVQAATDLLNSTAALATSHYQTHITVAQMIINATLETKLDSMEASSVAHQTILRGVGTLLEQKMLAKQIFYANVSTIIQNITAASVLDLQAKVNKTLLHLEYFDNKTELICDAFEGIMDALVSKDNTSALSFVNKATVLLDTIADIVNTTHDIHATFFANKTGTLLTTVADVFDILANASVYRHQAFVSKFNTSMIAFTDAIVEVKESAGLFKANVTATFAEKVSTLLETKAALHANVSRDLNFLLANLTESIAVKVSNMTTKVPHGHSKGRQATPETLWFNVLAGFFEGINQQFQATINATTNAFQLGVQSMQQQIAAVGQSAEVAANQINAQLNATMQNFACAQMLIPEFFKIFGNTAMRPITCSGDALSNALTTAMNQIEQIRNGTKVEIDGIVDKFNKCWETGDRLTCSPVATQAMVGATSSLTTRLAQYAVIGLPQAFLTAQCHIAEDADLTFAALQEKIKNCAK